MTDARGPGLVTRIRAVGLGAILVAIGGVLVMLHPIGLIDSSSVDLFAFGIGLALLGFAIG